MKPQPPFAVYLGWDARETRAWNIASRSLQSHSSVDLRVDRIARTHLEAKGLYYRPTGCTERGLWDEISGAAMSTGHAIARFLVPHLCQFDGWALFTDGDVLFREDIATLFALAETQYAVQVVQHQYAPRETLKMDGQIQVTYARKNWSSVVLWNCAHPSNQALTVELVNTVPGRDLHAFCWLNDNEIGALPERWNWLVGHSSPAIDPAIVHFTTGVPDMPGYEHVAFSDDWYDVAKRCGYRLQRPPIPIELIA